MNRSWETAQSELIISKEGDVEKQSHRTCPGTVTQRRVRKENLIASDTDLRCRWDGVSRALPHRQTRVSSHLAPRCPRQLFVSQPLMLSREAVSCCCYFAGRGEHSFARTLAVGVTVWPGKDEGPHHKPLSPL